MPIRRARICAIYPGVTGFGHRPAERRDPGGATTDSLRWRKSPIAVSAVRQDRPSCRREGALAQDGVAVPGGRGASYFRERLLPLLPVTPDVDRPSTFQARFLDRAGRCAGAFGLGEVGFECCQAGWRAGIRPRLRRIGGRAVAGARPAGISRVVRRCRGSRRVGGACRCRAGCRRPLRCGGGGSSGTRTRRDSGVDGRGAGHGRFRAPSA